MTLRFTSPTRRQRDFLACVASLVEQHGQSPTVQEIATAMGYTVPQPARAMRDRLFGMGYLTYQHGKRRSIRLVDPSGTATVHREGSVVPCNT